LYHRRPNASSLIIAPNDGSIKSLTRETLAGARIRAEPLSGEGKGRFPSHRREESISIGEKAE
jgi:hypothetical protein